MKYIDIAVVGRKATAPADAEIICGNSDYSVKFKLDEEWNDSKVKTARFVFRNDTGKQCVDRIFEGDTVGVPVMANTLEVFVGVFAGDLRTTTPARIPCKPSIRCGSGDPVDPTPSVYDQIMELLKKGGGGGVSPTVEVTKTENGHQIKITDIKGEHIFEIVNGEDGEPGMKGDKGDKGDAYVLTEADKTEIAEQAITLIDANLSSAIGSGVIV